MSHRQEVHSDYQGRLPRLAHSRAPHRAAPLVYNTLSSLAATAQRDKIQATPAASPPLRPLSRSASLASTAPKLLRNAMPYCRPRRAARSAPTPSLLYQQLARLTAGTVCAALHGPRPLHPALCRDPAQSTGQEPLPWAQPRPGLWRGAPAQRAGGCGNLAAAAPRHLAAAAR